MAGWSGSHLPYVCNQNFCKSLSKWGVDIFTKYYLQRSLSHWHGRSSTKSSKTRIWKTSNEELPVELTNLPTTCIVRTFCTNFVDCGFDGILWFHSHRCRHLILILHCTYICIEECTGGELRKPMMPVHAILCGILVFRCLVLSIRTIPASSSRSMWLCHW